MTKRTVWRWRTLGAIGLLAVLAAGAAVREISRQEFDTLRAQVQQLEEQAIDLDARLSELEALHRVRPPRETVRIAGPDLLTESIGPFVVDCVEFWTGRHGELTAGGKILYRGDQWTRYRKAWFDLWAYDQRAGQGEPRHATFEIRNFYPGTPRVFLDVAMGQGDASAVRSCKLSWSQERSEER
jgi:hypothetical protein